MSRAVLFVGRYCDPNEVDEAYAQFSRIDLDQYQSFRNAFDTDPEDAYVTLDGMTVVMHHYGIDLTDLQDKEQYTFYVVQHCLGDFTSQTAMLPIPVQHVPRPVDDRYGLMVVMDVDD